MSVSSDEIGLARVSDASPPAGQPPGRYQLFEQELVLEESGLLWNPIEGHLAGSSSSMLECMNFLASLDLLDDAQLWQVGFDNPLRWIGAELDRENWGPWATVEFENGRFTVPAHG